MSRKPKKSHSKKHKLKAQKAKSSLSSIVEPENSIELAAAEISPKIEIEQNEVVVEPEAPLVSAVRVRRSKIMPSMRGLALISLFAVMALAIVYTLPQASVDRGVRNLALVHHDYDMTIASVESLQAAQAKVGRSVIDDNAMKASLTAIQSYTTAKSYTKARAEINHLNKLIAGWQIDLSKPVALPAANIASGPSGENHTFAPILLYHHPPANIEEQFSYLVDHGYQSVSLQQVADAQNGKAGLPDKPIVITFDDGFADQMPMLDLLKKYNLKAVFYIINGGQASNFHIGANKKANDPEGGDAYLSWEQIKVLDESGVVEIAGHTMDHLDLAKNDSDIQRYEIIEGKHYLEAKLGHTVTDFCYPYGAFNASAIQIAKEAGYTTATTTLPGTDQSLASPFTMRRIRDAILLP
ncbi:MAG: polysaccharide deacetylase family protein [Candidatus Saccharibacteria bacterium]